LHQSFLGGPLLWNVAGDLACMCHVGYPPVAISL
jgi:hypothetical protein